MYDTGTMALHCSVLHPHKAGSRDKAGEGDFFGAGSVLISMLFHLTGKVKHFY